VFLTAIIADRLLLAGPLPGESSRVPDLQPVLPGESVFAIGNSNGSEPQQLNFLAPVALVFIEGSRRSSRGTALAFPVVWVQLFQFLSVAVWSPIYCLTSLVLRERSTEPGTIPARDSKIFLPAILAGYGIPSAIMAYHKKLFSTTDGMQGAIAWWQIFPLYIGAISLAFKVRLGPAQPESAHDLKSTRRHLAFTYKVFGAICAMGHVIALFSILSSSHPLHAFRDTFIPDFHMSRNNLIGLVHTFFACDCLLSFLALTIYAWAIAPKDLSGASFLIGFVLLGPGYTLMAAADERDKLIHRPARAKVA
jgi:hypothetical protein